MRYLLSGSVVVSCGLGIAVALLSSQGLDLVRGNAVKVPLILTFTALAIVLFALRGMLDWQAGLSLAAGQFFGAKLGVHLQVLKGQAWVRKVLTVMIVLFAIRLLTRFGLSRALVVDKVGILPAGFGMSHEVENFHGLATRRYQYRRSVIS